jgi:O-antigen/teichoic acid export membrane protein
LRRGSQALVLKGSSAVLGFGSFVLLARIMTTEQFGQYSFAFSIASLVAIACNFGQPNAVLRFYPPLLEHRQFGEAAGFLGWSVRVLTTWLTIGVVGMVMASLIARASGHSPSIIHLLAAAALVPALAVAEWLGSALRAHGLIIGAVGGREIVWRLGIIVWAAACLLLGQSTSAGTAMIVTAGLLLMVTLGQVLVLERVRSDAERIADPVIQDKIWQSTSMGFWGNGLLFAVLQNAAPAFAGFLSAHDDTARLFAALRVGNLFSLILVASNLVAGPMLSRRFAKGDTKGLQVICRTLAAAQSAPVAIAFVIILMFGPQIMELFGRDYRAGHAMLIIAAGAALINAMCGPCGLLLQMAGQERTYFRILATTVCLYVLAQLAIAPTIGAIGLAVAYLGAQALWNIWAVIACRRHLAVDPSVLGLILPPRLPAA